MPRLPLRGEPAECVLRFRVTRREFNALATHANTNSLTLSQVIAEAVAEYASDLTDADEAFAALVASSARRHVNSLTP